MLKQSLITLAVVLVAMMLYSAFVEDAIAGWKAKRAAKSFDPSVTA